LEIAQRLCRVSTAVLAGVKDNLNLAEDDVERRRFLFAHEAYNQVEVARKRRNRGTPRPDSQEP